MKAPPIPKPGEPPIGLVNDAVVADVTGMRVKDVTDRREALGLPPFKRGKTSWAGLVGAWGPAAALAWVGGSRYAASLREYLAGPKEPRDGRKPNVAAGPDPKHDRQPFGLVADFVIADIAGLSRFTVRVERERRGIPAGPKGGTDWQRFVDAWGAERATAYVAGTRYAAKLREFLSPRPTAEARRAIPSRLRALPVELRDSAPTVDPERAAQRKRERHPVPAGHVETVDEFLARGGSVNRVPSGVVTERSLRILEALRTGFPAFRGPA